jgi:hypothetical protein
MPACILTVAEETSSILKKEIFFNADERCLVANSLQLPPCRPVAIEVHVQAEEKEKEVGVVIEVTLIEEWNRCTRTGGLPLQLTRSKWQKRASQIQTTVSTNL